MPETPIQKPKPSHPLNPPRYRQSAIQSRRSVDSAQRARGASYRIDSFN